MGISLHIYPDRVAAKNSGAFNCVKWCRNKKKTEMNEHTDLCFPEEYAEIVKDYIITYISVFFLRDHANI